MNEQSLSHMTEPISALHIAYMAVALRDPNQIHLDEAIARAAGFDRPLAHGTFAIGHLGALAAAAAGPAFVRKVSVKLTSPVFRGARLHVSGQWETESASSRTLALHATCDSDTVATGLALITDEPT